MKLSSNFMKLHLALGIEGAIRAFADAGFDGIDFKFDEEELYGTQHGEEFFRGIAAYARECGIEVLLAHAPYPSSYADAELTEARFSHIVNAIKHAAWLGASMIVVHPCKHISCKGEEAFAEMMTYNLDFYRRLLPYAREAGIKIAIENIRSSVSEHPDGLIELFDTLSDDAFTVCYDIGHANIVGEDTAEMIKRLGTRIGCTHIHDNDGSGDRHTLPYYGTVNWTRAIAAFAEVGYTGDLSYEVGGFLGGVPLSVKPHALPYICAVGRHLIDGISHCRSTSDGVQG